jgi:hypothetical protein
VTGARTAWGEVVAFALLTVLGLAVVVTSFGYGVFLEGNRVGPGFLPLVTGALVALLGAVQLVGHLRGTASPEVAGEPLPSGRIAPTGFDGDGEHESAADGDVDVLGRTEAYRVRQLWTVAAAVAVAIALVPLVGFLISFGALVLFISAVVEKRPLVGSIAIAVCAAAIVYGVFGVFLNVPLPHGLIDAALGG